MSRAWAGPSTHTSVPGSLGTPRTLPLSGPVAALVLVAGPHPSLPGPPTPASQTHFRSFPRARSCSEAGHCPCPPESLPCPLCGPSPPRSHGLLPETQTCPAFQAWFPHPSAETAWASCQLAVHGPSCWTTGSSWSPGHCGPKPGIHLEQVGTPKCPMVSHGASCLGAPECGCMRQM